MSHHMTLTEEERVQAAAFWGDYFRRGGVGEQPTAFQLDAVNDTNLRDHLMFWQIDADPSIYNPALGERLDQVEIKDALGAAPGHRDVLRAITQIIKTNNDKGVELDDMDTGTVFILMHVMWLLLGGDFASAADEVAKLTAIHLRYQDLHPDHPLPHVDPLEGLGYAAGVLLMQQHMGAPLAKLLPLSAEMFGLPEDHENVVAARKYGEGTSLMTSLRKLDAAHD